MKRRNFLQALSAAGLLLWGCGSTSSDSSFTGTGSDNGAAGRALILPARQAAELTALRLAAESAAESAPVPLLGGAIRVDVDALTTLTETASGLTDLTALQSFFAALGVRREQPVVVYDDGEMKFAARLRFLLEYCGVLQAVMVDGGAPALAAFLPAGGGSPVPSDFGAIPTDTPIALVFQQQVLLAVQKRSSKIVDVRSPAEFNGQLLLPGDARPGHIPGAINVPEGDFLNELQLRSPAEIVQVFQQAGLSPADSIIVYCHDGAKSALVSTLLVQFGFSDVSLYYLSYRDWSENPALPVEL